MDIDSVREAWLRNMPVEARLWLAHIDKRAQEIVDAYSAQRMPLFEIGELLFNVCSYLNWLAHIHFREDRYVPERDHPKGKDIISFLQEVTRWPVGACEAFWFCVRNPVMHTGRSSLFADYGRKSSDGWKMVADLHPNLAFDPAQISPDQFSIGEQDGFFALPDPETPDQAMYWFYFPGIRRKLEDALNAVIAGIENADRQSVLGLDKINMKTLAFRVSGASE